MRAFFIVFSLFQILAAGPAAFAVDEPSAPDDNNGTIILAHASSDDGRTTDACFLVYKTMSEAAAHCPVGAQATKVRDFWTGQTRGYSCRCKDTGGSAIGSIEGSEGAPTAGTALLPNLRKPAGLKFGRSAR